MPDQAVHLYIASLSDKSLNQYNTGLKKWWNFCNNKKANPFEYNIPTIVSFLSEEFNKGAKYGTLNSIRSAISLIVDPKIAADHRVKRLLKGAYNLRPAGPRYDSTWDPQVVLSYFSNQPTNNELSLKQLSKKLITLLALITAHRMQTFSLIRVSNIELKPDKITIKISERIKTSGLHKNQPYLILPMFKENCKVCAATTLVSYLQRTEHIRKNEDKLLISFKAPHEAVGSQTLSRWVSETLFAAGIDTNVFSAHSTRHAATSAANRNGISLQLIRKTAGWSNNSATFAKFYNRELTEETDAFAKAIYKG